MDAGLNASRETTGEDCLWESKFYLPFPKTGMKQIEQFNDLILRILRFLAESSEVTQLELFQRFPILNEVSGVPTPSDSGKTPQLKTSKLVQNCDKGFIRF